MARLVARSQHAKVTTGREGLIGTRGRARTDLAPDGMVFVDGALWEATSVDGPVTKGCDVEVVDVRGLHLHVRAAEEAQPVQARALGSRPSGATN